MGQIVFLPLMPHNASYQYKCLKFQFCSEAKLKLLGATELARDVYLRMSAPASPRRDLHTPCLGREIQHLEAEKETDNILISVHKVCG